MLKPTKETIKEWKSIFEEYKSLFHPNNKEMSLVIKYLMQKYPMEEVASRRYMKVLIANIKMSKVYTKKIPQGKELIPIVFTIPNEGNARALYECQNNIYSGIQITVCMELETGFFMVEGSDELNDEITAFKGLDEGDLKNYYLVANYVRCLKKYKLLQAVLDTK